MLRCLTIAMEDILDDFLILMVFPIFLDQQLDVRFKVFKFNK